MNFNYENLKVDEDIVLKTTFSATKNDETLTKKALMLIFNHRMIQPLRLTTMK